jgi:hypothetical protein
MSWSPWNGVTVREIELLQPEALRQDASEPMVSVARVQVRPYWSELIRGRVRFREIVVESPQVSISVEMLASVLQDAVHHQPPPSQELPETPSLAAISKDDLTRGSDVEKLPSSQKSTGSPSGKQPLQKKPESPRKPKVTSSSSSPPVEFPLHLKIKGAELKLVSLKKEVEILSFQGGDLDVSLLGADSQGVLKIASGKCLGMPEIKKVSQTISWKRPYLLWQNSDLEVTGVKVACRAQIGLDRRARGVFLLDGELPPQTLERVPGLDGLALEVQADRLASRFRCFGVLPHPGTWQASVLVQAEHVQLKEEHGGRDVVFDEVLFPLVFRRSSLVWGGVRLIGEDVSVLANGRATMRGGVQAVSRLVVSPEVAEMVGRALQGAGLVRNGRQWWSDLDTPDRKMRDLHVSGSVVNPVIDLGSLHQDLPVWQVMATTVHFIREEMKEEGKTLPTALGPGVFFDLESQTPTIKH